MCVFVCVCVGSARQSLRLLLAWGPYPLLMRDHVRRPLGPCGDALLGSACKGLAHARMHTCHSPAVTYTNREMHHHMGMNDAIHMCRMVQKSCHARSMQWSLTRVRVYARATSQSCSVASMPWKLDG